MIKDSAAAYCCCVAALATLKNQYPARIEAPLPSGCESTRQVTYNFENSVAICTCGDYFAYAISSDKDFAIRFNDLPLDFASDDKLFVKMVFEVAAKVMNGLYGAELYLNQVNQYTTPLITKGDSYETISSSSKHEIL